ncbi:MAG: HypC/HybG/HupF family hydrogenase formation chaperone [Candidatus Dormibacteraceae bacterium]
MCLSVPYRVAEITDRGAVVARAGVMRRVSTALQPQVKEGDWVLAQANLIITILSEEERSEIERTFTEIDELLQPASELAR